jgi:AAA family ATP:ADP antiporter
MILSFLHKIKHMLGIKDKPYEGLKTFILGICFFIIIGSYTIIKELKDSIFCLVVGQESLPDAKNISLIVMIALVLFYGWLASKVRKEYLLVFYSLLYGIGGLVIAYFLKDPEIGFYNPIASSNRLFGWISYLFLEGYSPFVVSLLWAYFNSISHPEEVKTKYVLMTVCSKVGAFLTSGFAWLCMSKYFTFSWINDEVSIYFYMLVGSSFVLLLVPFLIAYLCYKIPKHFLLGYSEEQHEKKHISDQDSMKKDESGFKLLFKYPYTLGIFGMIFFWEAVNVVFNYMRLTVGLKEAESISDFGAFLYKNAMLTHLVGFFIAALGTSSLINIFGQRISLILIPILTGSAIIGCLFYQTTSAVIVTYIIIRAINYSFAYPLREALYIPTTDSIKFKTKSWIDSFGSKFSKAFASFYNKTIQFIPPSLTTSVQFSFFLCVIALWTILAYGMGKKCASAIKQKKIIGED